MLCVGSIQHFVINLKIQNLVVQFQIISFKLMTSTISWEFSILDLPTIKHLYQPIYKNAMSHSTSITKHFYLETLLGFIVYLLQQVHAMYHIRRIRHFDYGTLSHQVLHTFHQYGLELKWELQVLLGHNQQLIQTNCICVI